MATEIRPLPPLLLPQLGPPKVGGANKKWRPRRISAVPKQKSAKKKGEKDEVLRRFNARPLRLHLRRCVATRTAGER